MKSFSISNEVKKPDYKRRIVYSGWSDAILGVDPDQWNIKLEFPSWFISPSGKNKYIRINKVTLLNQSAYGPGTGNGYVANFPNMLTFHSDFNTETGGDRLICFCNQEFSDSNNYMYEYRNMTNTFKCWFKILGYTWYNPVNHLYIIELDFIESDEKLL